MEVANFGESRLDHLLAVFCCFVLFQAILVEFGSI